LIDQVAFVIVIDVLSNHHLILTFLFLHCKHTVLIKYAIDIEPASVVLGGLSVLEALVLLDACIVLI